MTKDIRWVQRLQCFSLALAQLEKAVQIAEKRELSDLEKQGLIQSFEFTHELAWNVIKDYFDYQGASQITGSRDATREAFNKNLIADGQEWMEMIKSRNQTTQTYNKKTADEITNKIQNSYFKLFKDFFTIMTAFSHQ